MEHLHFFIRCGRWMLSAIIGDWSTSNNVAGSQMWFVLLLHSSSSPAALEVKKCWSHYRGKTQRCSGAVLFTMPNITAPWVQYDWPCSVGLVFFWKALLLDTAELKTVKWNTSFEWRVERKQWGRDVGNTQECTARACVELYPDGMPLNSTGQCPWNSSWHCKAGCCWLGMNHTHRNFNWKQSCLSVIWHAPRKRSLMLATAGCTHA